MSVLDTMKLIALLLIAFCACLVLSKKNYDKAWKDYKKTFKRSYGPEEDAKRKQIFIKNAKIIEKHKKEADAGKHLYYMGINEFTDMSDEELDKMSPCVFNETKSSSGKKKDFPHMCDSNVPDSIDWNKRGRVTPVEFQGKCGACYAFGAVGALEGQVAAKTGKLVQLSKQMIVDCGYQDGNKGCNGGRLPLVFEFIKEIGGIITEDEYPFISSFTGKSGKCRNSQPSVPINMKRYYFTPFGDEEELKRAVGTIGPVAIAVPAPKSMKSYKHGIYMDPECATQRFAHALLVIGYDTDEKGTDYWIIKNSWGMFRPWGEKGFMRMKRNAGICNIGQQFAYPILV